MAQHFSLPLAAALGGAMLLSACATSQAPSNPLAAPPTQSANPPSNVNLQGFPLPYRQGYADGCASLGGPERKDSARFQGDGQYRMGWQDGNALCRKR